MSLAAPIQTDWIETSPEWPFPGLRRRAYGIILADPPWAFQLHSERGDDKSPQAQYGCMDLAALSKLPVTELAAEDCALAMWATFPMLPQAIELMTVWGFEFKSGGAWAKQSSTGKRWAFGTGYLYRSAAELWLLGTRGAPRQRGRRNVRNLIVEPVAGHSVKPDNLHRSLAQMFAGPACELFARRAYPGWDCWGDEWERAA